MAAIAASLQMPPTFGVAVVEDDAFFLQALCTAIDEADDLHLIGAAQSIHAARDLFKQTPAPAHLLLLNPGLQGGLGAALIHEVQCRWPDCITLASAASDDDACIIRSLECGAIGYLLKDAGPVCIVAGVREALAGGTPMSPPVARRVLRHLVLHASHGDRQANPLSAREQQVLEFMAKGFSYAEISNLMSISRNTVLSFVRRLYAKLQVRSQLEALYEARSRGLLTH